MSAVLFVVSATLTSGQPNGTLVQRPDGGETSGAPRKDYDAIVEALGHGHAEDVVVLDRAGVRRSHVARLIAAMGGVPLAQAYLAFRMRSAHRAILTDGEHIGIPLAILLKLALSRVPHVTIGHRLSAPKKRPFFRWLKVHSHIDRIALHSKLQMEIAECQLGIPRSKLALVPYQADADFWHPICVQEERLICAAGLEYRDYPTLFRAVVGLDVSVAIGAASYWSKRPNTAAAAVPPANVTIGAYDYAALRALYARAALVVVPLDDVDNQAGITSILEAMAMGKAVVVTHSRGQTDVVEDRRTVTRGAQPRPVPISLLRDVAELAGVELEPNGFYVPPKDPDALRRAIAYLLAHPEERAALGRAGRRAVERLLTVEQFAARVRAILDDACAPQRAVQPTSMPNVGLAGS